VEARPYSKSGMNLGIGAARPGTLELGNNTLVKFLRSSKNRPENE